jgi:hypothetical protein
MGFYRTVGNPLKSTIMDYPDTIHTIRMFFIPAGFSTHGERESAPPEQLMQPDDKRTTIPAKPGKDLV